MVLTCMIENQQPGDFASLCRSEIVNYLYYSLRFLTVCCQWAYEKTCAICCKLTLNVSFQNKDKVKPVAKRSRNH